MKTRNKIILWLMVFISHLHAQKARYIETSLFEVIDSLTGYYQIKNPNNTTTDDIISTVKQMYDLTSADEFEVYSSNRDFQNNIHLRYSHKHNGINVFGGGLNIHSDPEGNIKYINGYFPNYFDSQSPNITAEDAINAAIQFCEGRINFIWLDTLYENELKREKMDEDASYFPKPELMYDLDRSKQQFILVYKIPVQAIESIKSEYVYVKAVDGSIWKTNPLVLYCGLAGRAPQMGGCEAEKSEYMKKKSTHYLEKQIEVPNLMDNILLDPPGKNNSDSNKDKENSFFAKSGSGTGCNSHCNDGSATTKFYGSQDIKVGQAVVEFNCYLQPTYRPCFYRLFEDCNTPILTRFINNGHVGGNSGTRVNIVSDTKNFDNWSPPGGIQCLNNLALFQGTFPTQERCQIHWGMEKTVEFFKNPNTFNRNSFDNAGSGVVSNTDDTARTSLDNAFFDPVNNQFTFGKKGSFGNFFPISLDVIAHEFTHGVSKFSIPGGFSFGNESGALNESFSDIFGKMLEFYVKSNYTTGKVFDYTTGNDCFNNNTFSVLFQTAPNVFSWFTQTVKRDMENPSNTYNPDTYGGNNFVVPYLNLSPAGDFGGIHTNAQIQNHWFYLLAEGGSGTNDNNDDYCVQALGKDKATRIAYHNLTNNLLSNAMYTDARAGSIASAISLYGPNSFEVAQVTHAWFAVGVGADYNGSIYVKNHTATGLESYRPNRRVEVQNFTGQSGSDVTITSNTEIAMLPNISYDQGAFLSAYITPFCNGVGARVSNSNSGYEQQVNNLDKTPASVAKIENVKRSFNCQIMPNPSNGSFTLITNSEKLKTIQVVDVLGHIVYEEKTSKSVVGISLLDATKGIYNLKITENDDLIVKKLIVQ